MNTPKLRLLVTGASGLLGNKVVEYAANHHEVTPLHNTKPLHPNSVRLDITNVNKVKKLFRSVRPDAVIHTASETNVDKCETERERAFKINVEGTKNLAVACDDVNAKLVYISTDYVFDGEKGNYAEEDTPNPINYYGLTKLEGEKQVTQRCENYAVLRTSVLYGWHPWKQNFATWAINQLKLGKRIAVVEDHFNTPTLANSLAKMATEIAERDLRGIYHAAGSERTSRFEFARQIAKTFGLEAALIEPVKMKDLTFWVARRPKDSSLNTGKIQKQLETKPLSVLEGLKKMMEEAEE